MFRESNMVELALKKNGGIRITMVLYIHRYVINYQNITHNILCNSV